MEKKVLIVLPVLVEVIYLQDTMVVVNTNGNEK
jgi:hypothetical protein